MPAQLSMYGRDVSLSAFFLPDLQLVPDTLWLALCLVLPSPGDTGDNLVEPDDPAYDRVPIPTGSDWWELTGRGGVQNTQEVFFAAPTQDWGLIVGWALCDSETGGQTFYVGELLVAESVLFDPDNPDDAWGLGANGLVVKQT